MNHVIVNNASAILLFVIWLALAIIVGIGIGLPVLIPLVFIMGVFIGLLVRYGDRGNEKI